MSSQTKYFLDFRLRKAHNRSRSGTQKKKISAIRVFFCQNFHYKSDQSTFEGHNYKKRDVQTNGRTD